MYLNSWKRLGKTAYHVEFANAPNNNGTQSETKGNSANNNNTKNVRANRVTADITETDEEYLQELETNIIKHNTSKYTVTSYLSLTCSGDINRNSFNYWPTPPKTTICTNYFHISTCNFVNKVVTAPTLYNIIAKVSNYKHKNTDIMKMILDTGATRHMTRNIKLFHNLNLELNNNLNNIVYLADGVTTLPIHGFGNMIINIGIHQITINNVLYVPQLKDTLF